MNGSLKLFPGARCLYSGSITAVQVGATSPIPTLTLSLDKLTAMGAGGKNGQDDVFMFSMVKTK